MASSVPLKVQVEVDFHPANVDVRHNMTNHRPTDAEIAQIEELRERFIRVGEDVQAACPPSPERSTALTKLEEALMWAVASIARNTTNEES